MKYHSLKLLLLIFSKQFVIGSLTVAVASQTVMDAYEGQLELKKTN